MMAPAATAAASAGKAGADVAALFTGDKDAQATAQSAFASSIKEKGVDLVASSGYVDAAIKVSISIF
jgi:folate-dependent phosphoribosylglycinamide formyltransferase PurN